MKENIMLGVKLFIITAVAGIFLAFAYDITKEPIAKQVLLQTSAVGDVLTGAKDAKKLEVSIPEGSVVKEVNEAYDGATLVGHTMRLGLKGFHGAIDLVVGVTKDGKLGGIKIITHSETPGLGANIEKDNFKGQFKGKGIENDLAVVKVAPSKDNEIQAISGATISSNAVTNGINEAMKFYRTAIKGEAPEPEKTKESLVKEILPNYTKLEAAGAEVPAEGAIKEADKVFEGDKLVGYAIKSIAPGFAGDDIETIVVISTDNKVLGVRVLSHSETAGLGAEVEKDEFTSQFKDKSAAEKINEITAISGATKSSRAMKEAVNAATEFYRIKLSGKGGK